LLHTNAHDFLGGIMIFFVKRTGFAQVARVGNLAYTLKGFMRSDNRCRTSVCALFNSALLLLFGSDPPIVHSDLKSSNVLVNRCNIDFPATGKCHEFEEH
jgi:hypothetical protein